MKQKPFRAVLLAVLIVLSCPILARASVTVGTVTSAVGSSASSVSTTVTCGSGAFVVVLVSDTSVTAPTVALTGETVASLTSASIASSHIYAYTFTASTSHSSSTITASLGSSLNSAIIVVPATGTTGVDAKATGGTPGVAQSVSVTSVSAQDLALGFEASGATNAATAGSGYTIVANADANATGGSAAETGNTQSNSAGAAVAISFANNSTSPIIGILLAPTSITTRRRQSASTVI